MKPDYIAFALWLAANEALNDLAAALDSTDLVRVKQHVSDAIEMLHFVTDPEFSPDA